MPASGSSTFVRRNPVSSEIVTRAAAASVVDGRAAADAAEKAFLRWRASGPSERRTRLDCAADILESRTAQFVEIACAETGATANWVRFNVSLAAGMLREAAAMTTHICGEVVPSDVPGNISLAIRQPAGVVLGMAPWNAPIILGVRAIAMPLACGNTVILKASEVCPATHWLIGSVLIEAGMNDGIVNVIMHDSKDARAVTESMIAHRGVRRVNFTGSTCVGRIVAGLGAKYLKPVLLELGGKAPLVVLKDANIDAAVDATVFGAFANSGQICMSTERVLIEESIADQFVDELVRRVAALPVGDSHGSDCVLGSMVGIESVDRLRCLIADAVDKGATVLCGGKNDGTIMDGIVIDNVTTEMRLFHEESFGPQISITRVKSADEAVKLANETEYGLSAAIFSEDLARAFELAKRIESGICHINGPTVHDEAQMPFGGVKASGYGRFGGKASVEEFTELRWITLQTSRRQYPF